MPKKLIYQLINLYWKSGAKSLPFCWIVFAVTADFGQIASLESNLIFPQTVYWDLRALIALNLFLLNTSSGS